MLAISDLEFSERLKTNGKLQRTFDSIVLGIEAKDTLPNIEDKDGEQQDIGVDFIECALLNRLRFACILKYNFEQCLPNILEDEPTKKAINENINAELAYVLNLLRRFDSADARAAKADLQRWLDTNVLDDGAMEYVEESATDSDDESDQEGEEELEPAEISDTEEN